MGCTCGEGIPWACKDSTPPDTSNGPHEEERTFERLLTAGIALESAPPPPWSGRRTPR